MHVEAPAAPTPATPAPEGDAGRPESAPRAFETVLAHIERLVLDGELHVDDRLPPERELAQQLGVSRPAVREAIRTLEAQGVLASRVGSGALAGTHVIHDRSQALARLLRLQVALAQFPLDEVVTTRITLERTACELAAANATDADLAGLLAMTREMDGQHDPEAFNELDTRFHVRIAEVGGNTLIGDLTQAVRESLRRPILAAERRLDDWPALRADLQREHTGVATALAARDAAGAADLMEAHIRNAYSVLPMALAR